MFIKEVELTNIKKYSHKVIPFKEGLNFISGKNGAGKTTIIESIGYALFNYTATNSFANYFIKKGEKKGEVKISLLDKDNQDLMVIRKISQSSAGNMWAVYEKDNEVPLVSGNVDVYNYLKEHLEFFPDDDMKNIYESIISVPQGKFTQVFALSDKPRKEEFDPIFKLDTYSAAFTNIKLLKNLDDKINELTQEKSVLVGETNRYSNLITEIEEKKKVLDIENGEMKKLSKSVEEIKKKFEEQNQHKEAYKAIKEENQAVNVEYEKINVLYELKEKENKEIEKIKKTLEEGKEKYREYKDIEQKIEDAERKLKVLEKSKETSQQKKIGIEKGKSLIEQREKSLKLQEEEINKAKIKLQEVNEKLKMNTQDSKSSTSATDTKDKLDIDKLLGEIIQNSCELDNLKKQIALCLKAQTSPNKNIFYLNSATKSIQEAKKLSSEEAINHLERAEENIKTVIKSSDSSANNLLDMNALITNKEKVEEKIISMYNKYIEEKIEKIVDVNQTKDMFIAKMEELKQESNAVITREAIMKNESEMFARQIKDLEKDLKEKSERYVNENDEMKHWQKGIEDYEKLIKSLEKDVLEYENVSKNLEILKTQLRENKKFYEEYLIDLKKIERQESLNSEMKATSTLLEELKAKKENLAEKLAQITQKFSEEEYEKIRISYENDASNLKVVINKCAMLEKEYANLLNDKKHQEEIMQRIKEKEENIDNYKEVRKIINDLRNVINDAPKEISNLLVKNISQKATEIYSEIAMDSNRLEWENTYEIVLYDFSNGQEIKKTFKELSGGEQMTAALAVRIAMLEILTKLKIGILDEPTVNMDSVRREKLSEIIGKVSERFRQLIVVSHDDTFENITQNVISLP